MNGWSRTTAGAPRQGGWGAVLVLVAVLWLRPIGAVSQDGTPEPPATDIAVPGELPAESAASDTPPSLPTPTEEPPPAPVGEPTPVPPDPADAPSAGGATAEAPPSPEPTTVVTIEASFEPPEPVGLASPVAGEGEGERAVSDSFSPEAAGTSLSHAAAQIAPPGAVVAFRHDVGNLGLVADAKAINATSTTGWPVVVLAADGATPLADADGDGDPETTPIPAGQSLEIVIQATVPFDLPAGELNVVVVTAGSVHAQDPANLVSVQDIVTVDAVVTLTVDSDEVSFGRVAADGRLDGAAPGVTSEVTEVGAYYVVAGAFSVTVTSNAPWTGACLATQDDGTDPDSWIAGGRLEWRLAGSTTWTPFTTTDGACFPIYPTGTTVFAYDVRLRLERTDGAGTFYSLVTFTATP